MKNFFIALLLVVGILGVHLFVRDILYLRVADMLWLFIYSIGLLNLNEREFMDKRQRLRLEKIFLHGVIFRLLPLLIYAMMLWATMINIEFDLSQMMFLMVAIIFWLRVLFAMTDSIGYDR